MRKKLIDKDALLAEIDKLESELSPNFYEYNYDAAKAELLDILKNFLDTIEGKEVDLNREIEKEIETRWRGEYLFTTKFKESAKHFFELGLKAQKGE